MLKFFFDFQAWLTALVVIPMRSNLSTRVAIVALLIYLTTSSLPESVWKVRLFWRREDLIPT